MDLLELLISKSGKDKVLKVDIQELAKELNKPVRTVYRHFKALKDKGIVKKLDKNLYTIKYTVKKENKKSRDLNLNDIKLLLEELKVEELKLLNKYIDKLIKSKNREIRYLKKMFR